MARGGLGRPRPSAWAYLKCPVSYRHAESQWRRRISNLAASEGFAIERWWVDHEPRRIDGEVMLSRLPGSGVQALFLPYPDALAHIELFRRRSADGTTRPLTPLEISQWLHLQVFVLDSVMTIAPASDPTLGLEPVRRRRLAPRLWRRAS